MPAFSPSGDSPLLSLAGIASPSAAAGGFFFSSFFCRFSSFFFFLAISLRRFSKLYWFLANLISLPRRLWYRKHGPPGLCVRPNHTCTTGCNQNSGTSHAISPISRRFTPPNAPTCPICGHSDPSMTIQLPDRAVTSRKSTVRDRCGRKHQERQQESNQWRTPNSGLKNGLKATKK